jgi:leucyl-tRNA---protein transferase
MNEYFYRNQVTPEHMDLLWNHGWRHFGSYFFRYSTFEHRHVLPLRMSLSKFSLSQSQKRILKKNQDLKICFKPAFIDNTVTTLFENHKQRFEINVPDSIYTFMSKTPERLPCLCESLCLYQQDQLIAISYLDIGQQACSSIYQCFDPAFDKRSLGVLMILLSIQHALELKKTFYYPGYAFIEPSHYDYKKTFMALECFDWQGNWKPFPRLIR